MTPKALDLALLADLAETEPDRAIEELFGVQLWIGQRRMIQSFFRNPVTLVRSCHSTGKTFGLAACAVLPMIVEEEAIALTLSAKEDQLKQTVWSEIPRFIGWSKVVGAPRPGVLDWKLGPKLYLTGLTAENPTTLQGYHASRGYLLWDEIAGVENPELFKAVDSLRASGEWHVLYCMNPTRSAGPEVDLWNSDIIAPECKITLDAFETPNFRHETQDRFLEPEELFAMTPERGGRLDWKAPGGQYMISRRYAWEVWKQDGLGPSSPWWPRVRGEFPQEDFDTLIFRHWVDEAKSRKPLPVMPDETTMVGLDVAGPGEAETVAAVRRGANLQGLRGWKKPDPLLEIVEFIGGPREGLCINVDSAGIGFHLGKALERSGYRVQYVNVGQRAFNRERFVNAKAEFYWGLRLRFQEGDITGDFDPETVRQVTGLLYEHNDRNLIVIEPKEKARRRGVASPDRAEAVMLAYASSPWMRSEREWVYEQPLVEDTPEEPKPRAMKRWMEVMEAQKKARRATV